MTTHTPYLYKWIEKSTGKWYIGSRTAKGCHVDDGYICSSKIVKPLVLKNPDNWERKILCIGPAQYIRDLEFKYLTVLDAAKDIMSYNLHNGGGKDFVCNKHTEETRRKMSQSRKGKPAYNKGKPHSIKARQKMSLVSKGKPKTKEHAEKIGLAHIGMIHSDETKQKIRQAKIGKPAPNKGKSSIRKGIAHTKEHSENISKALLGKKKSIEAVEKNRLANLNRPKLTCQYCEKTISGAGNLKQHIANKHKDYA